jgi:hypothetical protein
MTNRISRGLLLLVAIAGCNGPATATHDAALTDTSPSLDASDDAGRSDDTGTPVDGDRPVDGGPPVDTGVLVGGPGTLDLLLMIDSSNDMAEEQLSIARELPRMIQIIASGDLDGDSVRDFTAVGSLHVGVVTSDMGVGTVVGVESCESSDDGILRSAGGTGPGCMATYPSAIFEFTAIVDDLAMFSASVRCVASVGTDGCGFAQPLESVLKALSLAPLADGTSPVGWTRAGFRPPVFLGTTFGHAGAGGLNDGFLRADSALAVVLVTTENDCSASEPAIFDRLDPRYATVDLNLRCFTFVDEQYPIERYVDGLVGLRADSRRLMFGAIAGVPQDAIDDGLDYDAILAHPEMEDRVDPVLRNRLLPSCTSPDGRGVAYAPRRIVQVAQGLEALGASTTVQSICNGSYRAAVDAILERIAIVLGATP